jgi:2-dehydropantoate 2-reductase
MAPSPASGNEQVTPERTVIVYGAGAVGCYLGGKLAAVPDARVTLVGRPPVVQAVAERGLILEEPSSRDGPTVGETKQKLEAATSAKGLQPADLVLLTVRTFDVAASLPDLRHLVGQRGLLVALQNGVGIEEVLAAALGRERVLTGTLTVSVGMEQPGVVRRYSRGGGVALATMNGSPLPQWVVELFATTGLPTSVIADYRSLRWSKLLLNMLGAAQSAILDLDTSTIARDPMLFRVEQLAFREAGRAMDALGVRTVALPGYPVPLARLAMRLPRPLAQRIVGPHLASSRGGHSPTMRSDMARGKTEVAALHGAVARVARECQARAPVNAALTELVGSLTSDPDRRDRFRGGPKPLLDELRRRDVRL